MSKISEFPRATEVKLEDLILLSKFISEGKYDSNSVPLSTLLSFFGAPKVVDVGVNLNTITDPGLYILQGADTMQASYGLNYPSGLAPGSKVMMIVSQEASPWAMIVQTYFYAKLNSNPCPYSRGKSGSNAWGSWTQPVSQSSFDTMAVRQINMSQNDTELHKVGNAPSSVWSFLAPDNTSSTPRVNTSPTSKAGVKFNLTVPNTRSIIGTYKGNTFIADQDGRFFGNVDTTQLSDPDNPKGLNWIEYIGVPLGGLPAMSYPVPSNAESSEAVLRQVIDLLRNLRVIQPGEAAITSIVQMPDQTITDVFPTTAFSRPMKVIPHNTRAPIYVRSSNPEVLIVPDENAKIYIESSSSDYTSESNIPSMYGDTTLYAEGVVAGKATLEMSTTSDFAVIIYSEEVEVKARS